MINNIFFQQCQYPKKLKVVQSKDGPESRFGIVKVMKYEIPCKGDIEITTDGSIFVYQITKSGEKKGIRIPKENGITDEYREVFNEGKTIGCFMWLLENNQKK